MNMLDYEFVKRQEKDEVPDLFSRKNSLLGIGVGIVEERTYYCLSSSENRYAVLGILKNRRKNAGAFTAHQLQRLALTKRG